MAISLNRIEIIGRLGRDPEFRAGATSVCRLRVATSYRRKGGEDETEWHSVTLFGKQAEIAQQYLRKGSEVYVCGRIHTRSYEKDGETRYATEIIGNEMQLGARAAQESGERTERPAQQTRSSNGDINDDIPF